MHSCTVVGYACDGDIYCPDCVGVEGDEAPVFAGDEFDAPHHCSQCGAPIAHDLTADGIAYVKAAIRCDFRRGRRGNDALRPNGPAYYVGSAGGAIALDWIATYGIRLRGWAARAASVLRKSH